LLRLAAMGRSTCSVNRAERGIGDLRKWDTVVHSFLRPTSALNGDRMQKFCLESDEDYLAHVVCAGADDHDEAIRHLRNTIKRARLFNASQEILAMLTYSIGKSKYWQGDHKGANRSFNSAARIADGAPGTLLMIGRFFLLYPDDKKLARRWLERTVASQHAGRHDNRWRKQARLLLNSIPETK
jgi:tetratricopeptide (TPR) repeat protein